MSNRLTNFIAAGLLIFVFFACLFSIQDDSLTMDELAHLPAGYSYLTKKDMRLNPEHPPLIKDLAALPLLFIEGIRFPNNIKAWEDDINGQWDFGRYFLYEMGNPTEKMIFWARIPMILILVLLGFYVFKWTKEVFGNLAALLALFFFSFSPTLLAHGRLVTTDLGAAAGIFIATYYFLKALKNPCRKNMAFAGISFGLAQLAKFTAILLLPYFAILVLAWSIRSWENYQKFFKKFILHTSHFILLLIIGFLLIGSVYQYHVWNYPVERQIRDTRDFLGFLGLPTPLNNFLAWTAKQPILRPCLHYFTGLLMVLNRATSGHTTYFLGEISNLGWRNYFPVIYIIKEPLAFHILTVITFFLFAWKIKKPLWQNAFSRLLNWIGSHFPEFSMLSFIFLYWASSLFSNLNIGVRHLIPVFPFTYLLVSGGIMSWLKKPYLKLRYCFLALLIVWQAISVASVFPYFLAYFNELVGGADEGYVFAVDSNLDWGQDLKRLKLWVEENNIERIYVDYFGGSDPKFHLKEKYEPWWGERNKKELPKGSYLAISATFYQGGRGQPVEGFIQPHSHYLWLSEENLVKKIGYSIFVFYLD